MTHPPGGILFKRGREAVDRLLKGNGMAWTPEDNSERLVPLIPGERFELALDEKLGAVTSPDPTQNALTVTDRRVIKRGNQGGKRVTSKRGGRR